MEIQVATHSRVLAKMPKKCTGNFLIDVQRGWKKGIWRLLNKQELNELNNNAGEFFFSLHFEEESVAECIKPANFNRMLLFETSWWERFKTRIVCLVT